MDIFRKFGILPVVIFLAVIVLVIFVRPHRPSAPAQVAATNAGTGSMLSYQRPAAPAVSAPPGPTCYDKPQYTSLLSQAQKAGLQRLGTGAAEDGREVDIYQETSNNAFAVFEVGTDSTGQFQACVVAKGKNLILQPQNAPATMPR